MNEERKSARSKADFIRSSGIGPELAMFVTEIVENPEAFRSISLKSAAKLKIRWTQFYLRLGDVVDIPHSKGEVK